MARPADRKIPLVPQAVFVYILWYPLIAVYPLYVYSLDRIDYRVYLAAVILDIVISICIYLLYPSSFRRPEPSRKTFSGKVLRILYKCDYRGLNCMPSMHCSMCFIILFSAWTCSAMGTGIQAGVTVLCCGILVSTLLTKQHVLIDMAAALLLAAFCTFVSGQTLY